MKPNRFAVAARVGGAVLCAASVAMAQEAPAPVAPAPANAATDPTTQVAASAPPESPPAAPVPAPQTGGPEPPSAAPPPPIPAAPAYYAPPAAAAPTPEARPNRLPYTHDGFFLRAALGPGWFHAWTDSSADTRRFYGTAANLELSMGGTPGKGFVFGGTVVLDKIYGLSSKDDVIDGDEPTLSGVSFSMDTVGVFADYYPDPEGGLDIHAMLGIGTLNVTRPSTQTGSGSFDNPDGFTAAVGAGYDWFVGKEWSLGVHGRLTMGALTVDESQTARFNGSGPSNGFGPVTVTVFIPSVVFAATYH